MMIITVVQTSLELSLGLVGRSIVRFRTAIKDPEELTYLFLIIGVGVGVGANRANIALMSMMVILPMVVLLFKGNRGVKPNDGLYISVISEDGTDQDQENVGLDKRQCFSLQNHQSRIYSEWVRNINSR